MGIGGVIPILNSYHYTISLQPVKTKSYQAALNVVLRAPSLQVKINVRNNGKQLSPKNVLRRSSHGKRTKKLVQLVQNLAKYVVRKSK